MAFKPVDSEGPVNTAGDMRDTIVKSGLSGVAATVLAVTVWSPAGLGGMIGTSLASGFGGESNTEAASTVGRLAPFPAPITAVELSDIRAKLRNSQFSLNTLRRETNGDVAHLRMIAAHKDSLSAAPMARGGHVGAGMDVTDAIVAPGPIVARAAAPAAQSAPIMASQPASPAAVTVSYQPPAAQLVSAGPVVTYIGGDEYNSTPDPNMELASLLLAY